MTGRHSLRINPVERLPAFAWLLVLLSISSCATNPSPGTRGPRGDGRSESIVITEEGARRDAALAAWANLTRRLGIADAPPPEFEPVLVSIKSIPPMSQPLYLPKVGEGVPMTEEETREALRRFLAETGPLLCTDRQRITLMQRIDGANGVKEARYEQRAFRYPVRGGYGMVSISFAPDRRVVQMSSTCIPDVENVRRSLAAVGPRLTPEKAAEAVVGRTAVYSDANGARQTYTVTAEEKVQVRELAVFPIARAGVVPVLEIHLVWEILVERVPGLIIYLDVVSGDVVGAEIGKAD